MGRVRPQQGGNEGIAFTEEQLLGVLREQEAGSKPADVCRKHRINEATLCKWKAEVDGLDVSDARRLRQFEEGNVQLKELQADTMLDNAVLKHVALRKW